jgi:hypothetical protein
MAYYCLLCGQQNEDGAAECLRCGIPRRKGRDNLPAGWEFCQIMYKSLERIDETYEWACFVAEICTAHDRVYAYETPSFKRKQWDSWYPEPPPLPTVEEQRIEQALINQLHADGWMDSLAGNGEPTNSKFWRRASQK